MLNDAATLTLLDGRTLGYADLGDPLGRPVFYFHGFPGSRLEASLGHEAARRAAVRLIALDRPGIGLSDPKPGRTMLDWADDVADAADALDLDRFWVSGGSGGGPYAMACAYRMPRRVRGLGLISAFGPLDAPGAKKQMRGANKYAFSLARRFGFVARFAMSTMAGTVKKDADRAIRQVTEAMGGPDAAVLSRPEVREGLTAVIVEAFRQGSRLQADDMLLIVRDWGFPLEAIDVPTYLWQGEEDQLVTPPMGRYKAAAIPGCVAYFYPGEGHLLVIDRMKEILTELTGGSGVELESRLLAGALR